MSPSVTRISILGFSDFNWNLIYSSPLTPLSAN